jgi:hypothetical protein
MKLTKKLELIVDTIRTGMELTADEVNEAEDLEAKRAAAEDLRRRVAESPWQCWFPSDVGRDSRDAWKPTLGRWRE